MTMTVVEKSDHKTNQSMAAGQSFWLLCQVDRSVMLVRFDLVNCVLQVVTCGQLVGLNASLIQGNR